MRGERDGGSKDCESQEVLNICDERVKRLERQEVVVRRQILETVISVVEQSS